MSKFFLIKTLAGVALIVLVVLVLLPSKQTYNSVGVPEYTDVDPDADAATTTPDEVEVITPTQPPSSVPVTPAPVTPPVTDPTSFSYSFSHPGIFYESGSMKESTSPYWWLDSGGLMIIEGGIGKTAHGNLPTSAFWYKDYSRSNPEDTDKGFHPQNIFRLVTKSTWQNLRQEVYFMIDADNLSASENRNESNGLLLFNRYVNEGTLYYAGIRVDGHSVIKKKQNGDYTTLAEEDLFPGEYDRDTNPNLLPKKVWIGVRTEVVTKNGAVDIKLYTDVGKTGTWKLVLEATDNGTHGPIIDKKAYAGIRTDFMDVDFSAYKVQELLNI